MRYEQYTQEELKNMSLSELKKVDIFTGQQEQHIQTLMSIQMELHPSMAAFVPKVFPHAITDAIKTKDQEEALQKEMDEYNETQKQNFMGVVEDDPEPEPEPEPEPIESEIVKPAFCQHCDSKGGRHKKECTRNLVTA